MKSFYVLLLGVSVGFSALAADTKTILEDVNAQIPVCPMTANCVQMIQVKGVEYIMEYDPQANMSLKISKKINNLLDQAEISNSATVGPITVKGYLAKENTVFKITAANLTVIAPKLDLDDCTSDAKMQRSELAVNAVLQALNITKEQVTFEKASTNEISNKHSLYEDYSFLVGAKHRIIVQQYQDLDQNQSSCALNRITIDISSKSCSNEQKTETAGLIAKGLLPFLKFVGNNVNYVKKSVKTPTPKVSYERFIFDSGKQNISTEFQQSIGGSKTCKLDLVTISHKAP